MALKYDKKMMSEVINSLTTEIEVLRLSVLTASQWQSKDVQEKTEEFLDKSYFQIATLQQKISNFYEASRLKQEQEAHQKEYDLFKK